MTWLKTGFENFWEDPTFIDRFWGYVDIRGKFDCWLWTRSRTGNGYGHASYRHRGLQAHRVAFRLTNGAIPAGLHVLHSCDVRLCVNPSHLFLGTALDNMHDAIQKGRFKPNLKGRTAPWTEQQRRVASKQARERWRNGVYDTAVVQGRFGRKKETA